MFGLILRIRREPTFRQRLHRLITDEIAAPLWAQVSNQFTFPFRLQCLETENP